jgi:hypothetical protein
MEEIEYYNKAKNYLLSFDDINDEILKIQLDEWKSRKPKNLNELFRAFLIHAQNRQSMPNSIGNIDELSDILFNFNHLKILEKYSTWEDIFDAIKNSDYSPPGRMEKSNNKSHWVTYCKSIISISVFLKEYKTLEDFQKFVNGFLTNEQSKLALPLLLKEEIFGFGFALACDFIKENVSPEFIKPDTHINDISFALGITKSKNNFQIFKDVISFCKRINKLPYDVDKLFWLVGSGKFYLSDIEIKSSKKDFLKILKSNNTLEDE